jgi:prepilin-type processing-associated H-X9-DG protein
MAISTNRNGTLEWVEGGNASRHFQVMSNELSTPKILICPSDNRNFANNFNSLKNENLSYFVGLDAEDVRPELLLSGDRNITNGLAPKRTILILPPDRPAGWTEAIHRDQGNIAFADGTVLSFTTLALRNALRKTGDSTNRIALPE